MASSLGDLATELVLHVFYSCTSVRDVLNLAATNHRLHNIFTLKGKLAILTRAAEAEYGPLHDNIQVDTYNNSEPANFSRHVPMSMSLLTQIVQTGSVANEWINIYQIKKWTDDYTARRVLTTAERFRCRRAVYRLWLYTRAFHNEHYDRTTRKTPSVLNDRTAVLQNWSNSQLAEMVDMHLIMRHIVEKRICPSNATVARKLNKRYDIRSLDRLIASQYSASAPLLYRPITAPTTTDHIIASAPTVSHPYIHKYIQTLNPATQTMSGPELHGWGDEIPHYYIVQDVLKLDPAQLLYLRLHAPYKYQVKRYIIDMGEWFENNGETFFVTAVNVLSERGLPESQLLDAISNGWAGIARREFGGRRGEGESENEASSDVDRALWDRGVI